jgi:hypothetical protein
MTERVLATGSQGERVTTSLSAPPSDESAGVDSHSNTPGPSYAPNRQPRGRGKGKQPATAQRQARTDQRDFEDPSQLRGIIQSLENQIGEIRTEHQSSYHDIMNLLQEMRRRGTAPSTLPPDTETLPIDTLDSTDSRDQPLPTLETGTSNLPGPTTMRQPAQFRDESLSPTYERPRDHSISASNLMYEKMPRLSRNIPETDPLGDGTDPTFRQWKASLRDKFRENADHFETERSRCTHVWLKTTGLARSYLTPRYTSANSQFASIEEMLACLQTYFLTGTEQEEARNRFNDMHMQDKGHASETFPDFKARFLADAIEGNVPESEWFFNLWNKLVPRIRIQNLGFKGLWNENFSIMVQHLTRVEMERARPSNRLAINLGNNPTSARTNKPIKKSSFTTGTAPIVTRFSPATFQRPDDRKLSRPPTSRPRNERGSAAPGTDKKCYNCGKEGHWKRECPEPPSVNELSKEFEQEPEYEKGDDDGAESEASREGNEEA